ncbi:hypothetical protein RMB13_08950 [Acinetobacter sp. V102_4]|uniref:hypothetical protein n=1 Tax=Acinetobacter sp. V102_4 TaxID=3072984 RepID=UPI00287D09FD|nr:hypothetical protein [Acinetobacter sp. V102_4]MDS7929605.1 hypothetical protein [Acinetobacter sp. V102_4]
MNEIKEIRQVKVNKLQGDIIDGDKHIHYATPKTLYDFDNRTLKKERDICKGKISELYLKRVPPFIWIILGTIFTLYCLYTIILPNLFNSVMPTDWAIVLMSAMFGTVAPSLWLAWIRYNDDELLADYKFTYKEATKILRKRGRL